jgi:hypothetical protein
MDLHAELAAAVADWRSAGYPHRQFTAVAVILQYAVENETPASPCRRRRSATPSITPIYARSAPSTLALDIFYAGLQNARKAVSMM